MLNAPSPAVATPRVSVGPRYEWLGGGGAVPETWLAGFLPWPCRAVLPGNLAPSPRHGVNLAPSSRTLAPGNLLQTQNLMLQGLRVASSRGRTQGAPGWAQAQDVWLTPRGTPNGRPFTLRRLYAALRARGVEPHPSGAEADGYMAAAVVNAYFAASPRSQSAGDESAVTPLPALGLAEGTWPRTAPCTQAGIDRLAVELTGFQAIVAASVGDFAQMASDLALMGCGRVRRVKQSDLYFACLFPEDEWAGDFFQHGAAVPKPDVILDQIRDGGFRLLGASTQLVTTCLALGIKVDLSPFNSGGGANQNATRNDVADHGQALTSEDGSVSVPWYVVMKGAPPWQQGCLALSALGWDPFYWQHELASPAASTYQQYALNVWPTSSGSGIPSTTTYMQECARRKALAVAAYSWGIGEWLAGVDLAAADVTDAVITDVVEVLEIGNELDSFWAVPTDDPNPPVPAPSTGEVEAGAYEAGRYLALLAGPIRHLVPAMRFRFELVSWHPHVLVEDAWEAGWVDDFANSVGWARQVIELGIVAEVAWWQRVASPGASFADEAVAAWRASSDQCGFHWPPSALLPGKALPVAKDLLHQLGFHWYHGTDHDKEGRFRPEYADSVRMAADVALVRSTVVVPLCRSLGFDLGITVGELAFPATFALTDGTANYASYYSLTNHRFQAAMLVRCMLTLLASRVDSTNVFTFSEGKAASSTAYPDYTFASWLDLNSTGVYNDVIVGASTTPYVQGSDCWPRPIWFAYRRLVWVLSQANPTPAPSVRFRHNERGCTVVEVKFATTVSIGPDGSSLGGRWRRVYFAWVDQYVDDAVIHLDPATRGPTAATLLFNDASGTGYEYLRVVPDLEPHEAGKAGTHLAPAPTQDANGYATPANLRWDWAGHLNVVRAISVGASSFTFTLTKANVDPEQGPLVEAPMCIFTNADLLGVYDA